MARLTFAGVHANRQVLIEAAGTTRTQCDAADMAGFTDGRSFRRAMKGNGLRRRMLPCGVPLVENIQKAKG